MVWNNYLLLFMIMCFGLAQLDGSSLLYFLEAHKVALSWGWNIQGGFIHIIDVWVLTGPLSLHMVFHSTVQASLYNIQTQRSRVDATKFLQHTRASPRCSLLLYFTGQSKSKCPLRFKMCVSGVRLKMNGSNEDKVWDLKYVRSRRSWKDRNKFKNMVKLIIGIITTYI